MLCTDRTVSDVDFVVEERKRGIAIRRDLPERFRDDPALARRIGEMLVDTLASLHTVDPAAVGLSDLGKPEGYVERQLSGWVGRWEAARTTGHRAGRSRHRVAARQPSGVAGDRNRAQRLQARQHAARRRRPRRHHRAARLGHVHARRSARRSRIHARALAGTRRSENVARDRHADLARRVSVTRRSHRPLRTKTGFDVRSVHWYYVFNIFRFAAILQQIYARFERGQTHDERFRPFGAQVNALILAATQLSTCQPVFYALA